jgi:hypothetical protein
MMANAIDSMVTIQTGTMVAMMMEMNSSSRREAE